MANEKPVPSSNAETVAIATTNGQTAFSFDWRADAANQVHAVYRPIGLPERVLVLGVDFSVQGLQNPAGGSILLVGFSANKDDVIYIYRDTLIEREKKWQNEGDYKADLVNKEQDNIYMIMQELKRGNGQALNGLDKEIQERKDADENILSLIGSIGSGDAPIYDTVAQLAIARIDLNTHAVRLNGRDALGDGQGGLFVDFDNGSSETVTDAGGRVWYRVRDVDMSRMNEEVLNPFTAANQNIYRKRIMSNTPYFFEGYNDMLEAVKLISPSTEYLYPQAFTIDEIYNQLFILFNDSGFIAVFQLNADWKTKDWVADYLGFFRAGASMSDSLQIIWEDDQRFIYNYVDVGILAKYDITALPISGETLSPVWQRDTKSNAFSFRAGTWALWQRAYPMGLVYMRSVLEFSDMNFNARSVIDMGLNSSGYGSKTYTPMSTYISKRQGQALGDGVIIQSHGGFWRNEEVTPFEHTGIAIYGYDGAVIQRGLIDPSLMKPILQEKIPVSHIENEGIFVSSEGYVFTLYVTQSRHDDEAYDFGLTFFKEMDTSEYAIDFSTAAVVSPLYDREKFSVGHFPRSGDNKIHNPHNGEAFDTMVELASWMVAVAHPKVNFYTTLVNLSDVNNTLLPVARWVQVINRNNNSVDFYVYNSGFLERSFTLTESSGSWVQSRTAFFENHAAPINAVIQNGEINLSGYSMQIDTEGMAATDDLTTINGGYPGARVRIKSANTSRKIVIRNSTGNIICGEDITLASRNSVIELWNPSGGNWLVTNYMPNTP